MPLYILLYFWHAVLLGVVRLILWQQEGRKLVPAGAKKQLNE
jgi:hypothetical protein